MRYLETNASYIPDEYQLVLEICNHHFSDEEKAAREYDKIAIQFHGPEAKTNFQYNDDEIKSILAAPKLEKLSNLF